MPLNRFNVTEQTRELLPVFPLFSAGIGMGWIITPTDILDNTPTFRMLMNLAPNWVWGIVWLAVGVVLINAVINESRKLFIKGLTAFIVLAVAFSIANIVAFFIAGATISAWGWAGFVAYVAWVQLKSLRRHDSDDLVI